MASEFFKKMKSFIIFGNTKIMGGGVKYHFFFDCSSTQTIGLVSVRMFVGSRMSA
jgi:hypothetical protein